MAEKYELPEFDGHTIPAASQVGELRFTVVPAEAATTDASPDAAATPFVATVRRQGATGPLPGEDRILRSFRAVCRRHRTPATAGSEGVRQTTHNLLCCVIKCYCPGVDRILPGGVQTPSSAGAGGRQRGEPLVPVDWYTPKQRHYTVWYAPPPCAGLPAVGLAGGGGSRRNRRAAVHGRRGPPHLRAIPPKARAGAFFVRSQGMTKDHTDVLIWRQRCHRRALPIVEHGARRTVRNTGLTTETQLPASGPTVGCRPLLQ